MLIWNRQHILMCLQDIHFPRKQQKICTAPEQQVSPLDNMNFVSLPLVGDSGFNFDFPFVSVAIEKTASGYRMSIGVSPITDFRCRQKNTFRQKYAGPMPYIRRSMFLTKHPFKTFKNGIKESFSQYHSFLQKIRAAAQVKRGCKTRQQVHSGAPTWRFDMQFGVDMEFTYMELTNGRNRL